MDLQPPLVLVTILSGQSLSDVADLVMGRLSRIDMPAGWSAASITLQASEDGVSFRDVFTDSAEYVIATAAAGRAIIINQEAAFDVRYWRIRSGTSGAPVVQGADRVLRLITAPQ